MESSDGSQSHGVDLPPLHDDENTFTSGYMPDINAKNAVNVKLEETDMNAVNVESEETDMNVDIAELEETIGGNIHDLVGFQDFFHITVYYICF